MISLSGLSPSSGEKLVPIDSAIEFTIIDDGTGINISTLNVKFSGYFAITNGEFTAPFIDNSTITSSGNNYVIYLKLNEDLLLGKVYDVAVHLQNNDNDFFHETYSFKTIPNEPVLVSTSPDSGDVVTSPQMIYLSFDDSIDGADKNTLKIWINDLLYINNGNLVANLHGGFSTIEEDDTTVSVRIDLAENFRNKNYKITYQISDSNDYELNGSYDFDVELTEAVLTTIFPQITFLGYHQGINKAENLGTGTEVKLTWHQTVKRSYQTDSFVLLYQNEERLNVFDSPKYIAFDNATEAIITGLSAGVPLSFAARALEVTSGIYTANGMVAIDTGVYIIPEKTELTSLFSSDDYQLTTFDSTGYPDTGLLLIGREVIRYNAIDRLTNTFTIPTNGRGLIGTTLGNYFIGDTIEMFLKCTDQNTVISSSTPDHQDGYGFDRQLEYEGVVVTDFSKNDELFFQGFDYCGWHDPQPNKVLLGNDNCGSYLGGEYNGFRGMNMYDRLLDNAEVQLTTVGEPVILLKRIWNGQVCSCIDLRKMSPRVKNCNECYGTHFNGGYEQYHYSRRSDRRILISIDETPEDLLYGEKEGLKQAFEPNAWTLPMPSIRDRDLLLRFDLSEKRTFIYEVLTAAREPIYGRLLGMQKLSLKRLDKTDIVYTFPIDLTTIPDPTGV